MYQCYDKKRKLKTYIEDTDNCMSCVNQLKCPLVGALFSCFVIIPDESMNVDNCEMYIVNSDKSVDNVINFNKI
jgi:hypothetical protein